MNEKCVKVVTARNFNLSKYIEVLVSTVLLISFRGQVYRKQWEYIFIWISQESSFFLLSRKKYDYR